MRRSIYRGVLVSSKRNHYILYCLFSALYDIGEVFSPRYFWPLSLTDWKWAAQGTIGILGHWSAQALK